VRHRFEQLARHQRLEYIRHPIALSAEITCTVAPF
jgi:hypothetical protein